MITEYLIVGQGISGTWMSYYLQKEGKQFHVIDNNEKQAPSRIAAGVINPVTGRRHVKVWMADEIIPFARKAYDKIGAELDIALLHQKNILDFFPSAQMRQSFMQRESEGGDPVFIRQDESPYTGLFHFEFGFGEIKPVYLVSIERLLSAWRGNLQKNGQLTEEEFETGHLQLENDGLRYRDIRAKNIIFCDGNSSVQHPFFSRLPFAPNKGELLTLEIPGLPADAIYKKGMMLVPLAEKDQWWLGSTYEWEFNNTGPTTAFRKMAEEFLGKWLRLPFRIMEHQAGIRPATIERRPFVGVHPHLPRLCLLNGMGTKGCSLAPYFAYQLTRHLVHGEPITPEADIKRFTRVLAVN